MPRYQITAPDGRVVTVEGAAPPTDADAEQIFKNLPAKAAAAAPAAPAPASVELPESATFFNKDRMMPVHVSGPNPVNLGPVADVAMQGGGAAAGQALGALVPPPFDLATIPLGGAIGGGLGDYAAQKRRIAAGEQDKVHYGELLSAAGVSAIPGMPLEAAGTKAILREGVKQGLGGLAGKGVQTTVDEGRLPTPAEAAFSTAVPAAGGILAGRIQSSNTGIKAAVADAAAKLPVKNQTLIAAQREGYVVPPSTVNDSFGVKQMDSLAGKAAVNQQVSRNNQLITNSIVKRELGVPQDTDVTMNTLRSIRTEEGAPYAEVERLAQQAQARVAEIEKRFNASDPHELAIQKSDPATLDELKPLATQAAADVEALKQARFERDRAFDSYRSSGSPEELARAIAARDTAAGLEINLEEGMRAAGRPELADQLKAARVRIAKTYAAEEALNLGDANFDASNFGRQLDRGAPLTGGLLTIGKFQQAFPAAVREGSKVPAAGVSALNPLAGALSGGAAFAASHNLPLSLAATVGPAVAREAARGTVLSGPYQRAFARLPAPPINATPDLLSTAVRTTAQAVGGQPAATPTELHIAALRAHPDQAAAFDEKFGPGAAAKILGAK